MTALTTPDRNRTFVQELQRQADHRPDGVYLWHDGVPTTFGEQRARACSVANQLGALGISRGDRVATFAGNWASFVDLWLGAPQAGMMNVLLNTANREGNAADVHESPMAAAVVGRLRR